jgi:hypothetical protein
MMRTDLIEKGFAEKLLPGESEPLDGSVGVLANEIGF